MGEANRKRKLQSEKVDTPASGDYFRGVIDLHMLPPVPEVNGARRICQRIGTLQSR